VFGSVGAKTHQLNTISINITPQAIANLGIVNGTSALSHRTLE
jgi:hypothetical protein